VKNWKACERRIAEEIGGVRMPVSGRGRGDSPDVDHPSLSIEVKSRKKLPAWLLDAIAQAEAAASPDQIPVAVLHQDRSRYSDALVVMRLSRLESLTTH
jgi:hypothetical protein